MPLHSQVTMTSRLYHSYERLERSSLHLTLMSTQI